jgi:hypothetical protein
MTMRNKCIPSIRAAIAAMAAFMLFDGPALAGNLSYDLGITPDRGKQSESRRDGNFESAPRLGPFDAEFAAILGKSESARHEFFSPVAVGNTTISTNTDFFDIRDSALLGRIGGGVDLDPMEMIGPVSDGTIAYGSIGSSQVVESLGPVPNLTNADQDRPAVIKWIYSLLEAVGINERCNDPEGCGSRVAVNE